MVYLSSTMLFFPTHTHNSLPSQDKGVWRLSLWLASGCFVPPSKCPLHVVPLRSSRAAKFRPRSGGGRSLFHTIFLRPCCVCTRQNDVLFFPVLPIATYHHPFPSSQGTIDCSRVGHACTNPHSDRIPAPSNPRLVPSASQHSLLTQIHTRTNHTGGVE